MECKKDVAIVRSDWRNLRNEDEAQNNKLVVSFWTGDGRISHETLSGCESMNLVKLKIISLRGSDPIGVVRLVGWTQWCMKSWGRAPKPLGFFAIFRFSQTSRQLRRRATRSGIYRTKRSTPVWNHQFWESRSDLLSQFVPNCNLIFPPCLGHRYNVERVFF